MDTKSGSIKEPFETNDEICQKLVEEFVDMTQTDEALAQFYLQDRNWNLSLSLNDYFEHISNQSSKQNKRTFDELVVDSSDDSNECDIVFDNKFNQNKTLKCDSNASSSGHTLVTDVKTFSMICWNIDGIDEKNLRLRTESVSRFIKSENSLIVFLQEVVNQSEYILRQTLPEYQFLSGNNNSVDYYTLTLIHKNYVKVLSNELIEFENSSMGRNLLKTRVSIGSASVCLLNTHLESTKEFSDSRVQQLNQILKEVMKIGNNENVIFGGDLNLRDKEVAKTIGIPNNVYDVWIKTGARKEVEYTWDLLRNDNLQFSSGSKFKPRFRFDRIFVRPSIAAKVVAIHFGLIGLQRLKPYVCFPSDHWGLKIDFNITE